MVKKIETVADATVSFFLLGMYILRGGGGGIRQMPAGARRAIFLFHITLRFSRT